MPIDRINDIMTSNQDWKNVGLGESGETYIVGDDYTMRNQSRFLIEDPENYFKAIRESGIASQTVDMIESFKSSIGLQPVKTEGTISALKGNSGTSIFPDYRGIPVFSSYRPLQLEDVNWVIMSEMDEAEAFAPVEKLKDRFILGGSILVCHRSIPGILFQPLHDSKPAGFVNPCRCAGTRGTGPTHLD